MKTKNIYIYIYIMSNEDKESYIRVLLHIMSNEDKEYIYIYIYNVK